MFVNYVSVMRALLPLIQTIVLENEIVRFNGQSNNISKRKPFTIRTKKTEVNNAKMCSAIL